MDERKRGDERFVTNLLMSAKMAFAKTESQNMTPLARRGERQRRILLTDVFNDIVCIRMSW